MKLSISKERLTSSDLEKILGKPKFKGPDNENGGYLLHYESGDYELFFSAETKEAPISYLIYKKLGVRDKVFFYRQDRVDLL